MHRKIIIVSLAVLFTISFSDLLTAQTWLNEHFKALEPFIGKTWKGKLSGGDTGEVKYDVSRWEAILNGQALRNMHSINDGEYGGETILYWDKKKKQLVYYYFTTAGFYTNGTMKIDGERYISHEYVTGNKDGITEVQNIIEWAGDGRFSSKARYFKNGEWVDGHTIIYEEAPEAEVKFK